MDVKTQALIVNGDPLFPFVHTNMHVHYSSISSLSMYALHIVVVCIRYILLFCTFSIYVSSIAIPQYTRGSEHHPNSILAVSDH